MKHNTRVSITYFLQISFLMVVTAVALGASRTLTARHLDLSLCLLVFSFFVSACRAASAIASYYVFRQQRQLLPTAAAKNADRMVNTLCSASIHPLPNLLSCCLLIFLLGSALGSGKESIVLANPLQWLALAQVLNITAINRSNPFSLRNPGLSAVFYFISKYRVGFVWDPQAAFFVLSFVVEIFVWSNLGGWFDEELDVLLQMRHLMESQEGVKYKPAALPRVGLSRREKSLIMALSPEDPDAPVQGFDLSAFAEDEDGEIGHSFAAICRVRAGKNTRRRRKCQLAELTNNCRLQSNLPVVPEILL